MLVLKRNFSLLWRVKSGGGGWVGGSMDRWCSALRSVCFEPSRSAVRIRNNTSSELVSISMVAMISITMDLVVNTS